MKIDAGIIARDARESGPAAKVLEESGYDGAYTFEGPHDPFLHPCTPGITAGQEPITGRRADGVRAVPVGKSHPFLCQPVNISNNELEIFMKIFIENVVFSDRSSKI